MLLMLSVPLPPTSQNYLLTTIYPFIPSVSTYNFEDLKPGHEIDGPAIIVQSISTIILEIGCTAVVTADGDLDISVARKKYEDDTKTAHEIKVDPVLLSIYAHRFMGIAEQMGRTLARTAISVNIKERLDFSVRKIVKINQSTNIVPGVY